MQRTLNNAHSSIDELIELYQQSHEVVHWPLPAELEAALEVTLRNDFAEHLSHKSPEEIGRRYTYLTADEVERLLQLAQRHVLPGGLRGTGIELGAGCGLLAAVAAKQPAVRAVLAVEVCQRLAELLIGKVAASVLGQDAGKVIPVVGSFDDLQLPDESIDFAIENDSLHHSGDLAGTMSECSRVLKPGGVLLCFDRCHPNTVTDDQVEEMLSVVYPEEFLRVNCYPLDMTLTRRENGEHEYRLFEWEAAARAAGMDFVRKCEFERQVGAKRAIKGALSVLPRRLRRAVYQTDNASAATVGQWLRQELGARTAPGDANTVLAPKRTTVLLFQKPGHG